MRNYYFLLTYLLFCFFYCSLSAQVNFDRFYTGNYSQIIRDIHPGPGGNLTLSIWFDHPATSSRTFNFGILSIDSMGNPLGARSYGYGTGGIMDGMTNGPNHGFQLYGRNFDPSPSRRNAYVLKIDSARNPSSEVVIGDSSQSLYAFYDAVWIPGENSTIFIGEDEAEEDALITKLDSNGMILWSKLIGDSVHRDRGEAIYHSSQYGTVVAGRTDAGPRHSHIFIMGLDNTGNPTWEKTLKRPYGYLIRDIVSIDTFLYVITTGIVGPGASTGILKLGPRGHIYWFRHILSGWFDLVSDAAVDETGNIILAGSTYSPQKKNPNALLMKVDSSGKPLWSHTFGDFSKDSTEYFNAVLPAPGGGIYAGGRYGGTDYQTRSKGYLIRTRPDGFTDCGGIDVAVTGWDTTWQETPTGFRIRNRGKRVLKNFPSLPRQLTDSINCISCQAILKAAFGSNILNSLTYSFADSSLGSIVSWHWDFGDGNTDTVANPTHSYSQSGSYTVCLIVESREGCRDTLCRQFAILLGRKGLTDPNLRVWPQPAGDQVFVSLPVALYSGSIGLYDLQGRQLRSFCLEPGTDITCPPGSLPRSGSILVTGPDGGSNRHFRLSLQGLPDGVYFLKISQDSSAGWAKVIVQR